MPTELTIHETKELLKNLVEKAELQKREYGYVRGVHQGRCILCLNYEDHGLVYAPDEHKVFHRAVRIGTCHYAGWEVSSADRCDHWQDDA